MNHNCILQKEDSPKLDEKIVPQSLAVEVISRLVKKVVDNLDNANVLVVAVVTPALALAPTPGLAISTSELLEEEIENGLELRIVVNNVIQLLLFVDNILDNFVDNTVCGIQNVLNSGENLLLGSIGDEQILGEDASNGVIEVVASVAGSGRVTDLSGLESTGLNGDQWVAANEGNLPSKLESDGLVERSSSIRGRVLL